MLKVCRMLFPALAAALISIPLTTVAQAQGYPNKLVRIVVPFPPGGPVDVVTRIVAPKLGEILGQLVVVENRSGASGTIGTGIVAKSAPDGYMLILGTTTTLTVAPRLYRDLPYDPVKDLQPVSRLAVIPSVLVVHPSVPVGSVRELIALARAQPGKLLFGSAGAGTSQHLAVELFKHMAGIDLLHVPYKGGAPAMADLLGGQIALTIEPLNTALPQVRPGKLKGLAVTTLARIPALPDLPPVADTLPGYESTLWFSLLGPAGMPRDIVNLLHAAIVKTVRAPEVRDRLAVQGADPIGDSVEEFAEAIRRDSVKWAELVKKMGLKLD